MAQDVEHEVSDPGSAYISVAGSIKHGDVNRDDNVTLADAILALKVACNLDAGGESVSIGADVNGDDKIGMAEVVYILQKVAGLR